MELSSPSQARVVPLAVVCALALLPHRRETTCTVALCKGFPGRSQQAWPQGIHLKWSNQHEHLPGRNTSETWLSVTQACQDQPC